MFSTFKGYIGGSSKVKAYGSWHDEISWANAKLSLGKTGTGLAALLLVHAVTVAFADLHTGVNWEILRRVAHTDLISR